MTLPSASRSGLGSSLQSVKAIHGTEYKRRPRADPPTEMQGYRASPTLQFMSRCLQMTWNCSAMSKFREMLSQPVISDQPLWTFGGLLLAVLLDG